LTIVNNISEHLFIIWTQIKNNIIYNTISRMENIPHIILVEVIEPL
jgi:hypothetical protein